MKTKVKLCVLLLLVILLAGCGKNNELNNSNDEAKGNYNSVVLYFSATGTTKKVAEKIAKYSNSDIIEIIPKEEYKKEDLDYNNDCRANREQNNSNARPQIKNSIDISKYDVVYLGYPIWWGTSPKIILTLLDSYDFTGKVIFSFCTSGSSSIDKSIDDLRNYNETDKMKVNIDGKDYIINLDDNVTAKKLYDLAPFQVTMNELNGNEKYVYLASRFPVNPYKPGHIEKGDVMLFDNSCLVIFYKSFDTSYSYTRIGHIDNLDDLGNGNVTAKFEKFNKN